LFFVQLLFSALAGKHCTCWQLVLQSLNNSTMYQLHPNIILQYTSLAIKCLPFNRTGFHIQSVKLKNNWKSYNLYFCTTEIKIKKNYRLHNIHFLSVRQDLQDYLTECQTVALTIWHRLNVSLFLWASTLWTTEQKGPKHAFWRAQMTFNYIQKKVINAIW
jgi:hypothetical protein